MASSLDDIALDRPADEIDDRVEDSPGHTSKSASELLILQQVKNHEADRELRERFGDKAYKVVRKTLYGWAILLFCYGYAKIFGFEIFPNEVMIAITTAVTLNVFAAFLGVIRGLFPSKASKD
ncbi:hypothetical protein [Pantoea sp.]|uniref:hypothetical protein n=1 Tax=Pantoea sp. TaxID=69393 RepID=UPI0028ADF0B8|nr:hypothetical protein [Pantoea sp.]